MAWRKWPVNRRNEKYLINGVMAWPANMANNGAGGYSVIKSETLSGWLKAGEILSIMAASNVSALA